MYNTKFETYKLSRLIKQSGKDFVIKRRTRNEFNELSGEVVTVGMLRGIYHESNSYETETVGDASIARTKKQPMVLCLKEEVDVLDIKYGDYIEFEGRKIEFVKAVDVQNWGKIADLSFQEVDEGGGFGSNT